LPAALRRSFFPRTDPQGPVHCPAALQAQAILLPSETLASFS